MNQVPSRMWAAATLALIALETYALAQQPSPAPQTAPAHVPTKSPVGITIDPKAATPSAAHAPASPKDAQPARLALEVPVKGRLGKEIVAPGIENAFKAAKRLKATDIVFRIDSDGGAIPDADAISSILTENASTYTYHCVIEKCLGATNWILAHADHVYVTPGAASSVALAYPIDPNPEPALVGVSVTGPELAANIATHLAARAEGNAIPPALFRALVRVEDELYTWTDAAGTRSFSSFSPEGELPKLETLDTAESTLSVTGAKLIELGLARSTASASLNDVATAAGWTDWKSAGKDVATMMKAAADRVADLERRSAQAQKQGEKAVQQVMNLSKEIAALAERAESADPRALARQGSDREAFLRRWREACDKCDALWGEVIRRCADLDRTAKSIDTHHATQVRAIRDLLEFRKLGKVPEGSIPPPPQIGNMIELEAFWQRAKGEQEWMRANRRR